MLGAVGGNQALISPRTVTQLSKAGQIKHRSSPAIQIAGPAYTSQFEHRSSPAIINAGPVITTGASHAADTSERIPMEDRPIFQAEQSGTKHHCITDTESNEEKETRIRNCRQSCLIRIVFTIKVSKKLKVSHTIENYVNTHFRSCLSSSIRRAMASENPLPNIPALTAPTVDNVIVDYMGGSFPSKPGMQLKRLQSTVNAAPILNLWSELEEQELTTVQGGLVPVEVVLECFQKTLVLLGDASNYMSLRGLNTVSIWLHFKI